MVLFHHQHLVARQLANQRDQFRVFLRSWDYIGQNHGLAADAFAILRGKGLLAQALRGAIDEEFHGSVLVLARMQRGNFQTVVGWNDEDIVHLDGEALPELRKMEDQGIFFHKADFQHPAQARARSIAAETIAA